MALASIRSARLKEDFGIGSAAVGMTRQFKMSFKTAQPAIDRKAYSRRQKVPPTKRKSP
jgi:Mor family transcriptional regulator